MKNCQMCDKKRELRLGWCWNCAKAQSIISEGVDMYEKGLGGTKIPIKEANDRLKMLIDSGWNN